MPYGLPREIDTPGNNSKMERCVSKVMASGKSKESAIKICKSGIMKSHTLSMVEKKKND